MQAIDLLEQYADLIIELHKQSSGLGDLIAKCMASNQDLAGLSDATYRKLLPGFIRGLEHSNKRISELESKVKELESKVNDQMHDNAKDINMMIDCYENDTQLKPVVASDTLVDTSTDTSTDTSIVSTDTSTDTSIVSTDTSIDTIAQQALNALMPMIKQTVRNLVNGVNSPATPVVVVDTNIDTSVDTSIVSSDTITDIPTRIKGYRVNLRKDGRYVLLNGKTTIYIGKHWDMDKALRLIAAKETLPKAQQVPLLA